MFGKKENGTTIKPVSNSSSSNITYIADDCEIKGSIEGQGNARIDGKVEGTINIAGDLVIGQNAVLQANIEAKTISIAGEIRGNVKAKELLELASSARLYGDINTKQLKIDQGARFVGSSNYEEVASSPVSNPVTKENDKK
ncbi:MAG: cell shape determination protein CcmA [Gracilibacter sp. BRH_c7a]|nr:MAG: cell shape determination protein CcmA [Gracilibacter sp. BRH_c7a]